MTTISTLVIWAIGAGLLLINILLRTRILRLEAHLRALRQPHEPLKFLRKQAQSTQNNQVASIKALRKEYPEVSLIEAKKLWQQIQP